MKKKYLYNGEYYTESEMNDFAKQSGVSFDSYIAALGKDVKVLDAPYEYKGNFYTQDEISAAAKKKGINDDAYLSQNGIKKKEEAYTGGAMSSAASKIGGQVGNFVGQSEKDNALSLIQSINAGITKGIEKGKQQFPNEIRATPEEEAALRDAQRRTGQADGLFTQQGAEQFNLLATDPLRAILDPEREKLQTAYNNRRLQGVRQTSDNTIARNNIDPNKTVQKKDGKLIPDVSSNPEYQVKNQEQALENVSGLVKNKFFKNGKEALEYAENQVKSGIDPTGNETIEHAITKAGEYKQKEESALNGKSIIQNAIEIQLQNDPLFKKQYETIINGTASDAEIADVARRFNIPLDKLKTQGSLPQEVVGELVHRFISDPDIKQIAEDNPEFKKDFDNFTGDKIYEVFPEYADVYIKNTLSRARELDGKNNWFANPIFDKSKYMDNLAEEVFKDRPILLKRVKDKFHNNWEHKIETTGIVDDLATGARGAMSGMWRSLKDVSGFGESYSDRIRNTLKEQYGHVETPHQNEFRKVVGEASNFMGMVLAMGATGSGLGNIGKGLGVMNPSVASKAVTLATFFDDELNHAASIYPENPTKAYLRASLSTAFFLVAGDAIPASKITGFKQNITQTLKSLETKALDKQAKMKLRDKILSVATETLQGTAKGTAEMTVMINGFKLLIDRALGLDESSINNEYSDANLLATAKSMLFGLPVPSMIHGFKGINRTRAAIYEMASNPEKYKSAILKRFGSDDHRIADIDFIADFKKYLDSMRVAENEKAKMVFNALHAKRLREQKSPDAFMKRNHEEEIRAIEQEQQDIMDGKDSDAGLTDSQKAIKTAYENGEINEMMEAQIKEALKDPAKADQFIKEIAEQATGAVAPELGNAKDGAIKFFGETLTDFAIGKSGKKGGGESVVFEYENEGEVPQKLKPLMVKDENGRITITMPKDEADALQKRIAEGLEPDMELMDGTLIKKADIKIKDVQDGRVKYKGEDWSKDVESTAKALEGKTEGLLSKPTDEVSIEDLKNKNFSTFIYNKESDVPEIFKDKITSKGTTNGKTEIRVTLPKSEADYYLNKDNPQAISEAYHKAKADGSNPELVKAVESLLSKEQQPSVNKGSQQRGNPALSSVESTAKALEGIDTKGKVPLSLEYAETDKKAIAEAYHADRAAGKETELTKAVEELLGKPTEKPKTETTPTVSSEVVSGSALKDENGLNEDANKILGLHDNGVNFDLFDNNKLRQIAKDNGIDLPEGAKNADIIEALKKKQKASKEQTQKAFEDLTEADIDKLSPSEKAKLYKENGITNEDGSEITEKDIKDNPLQYSYDFMASSNSGKWNSANSELESAVQGNKKQYSLYKLMAGEFDTFKEFVDFINSKNYGDKIEYTERMRRADETMTPEERKSAIDSYNKSAESNADDKAQKGKDVLKEHGFEDEKEYSPQEIIDRFPLKGVQKIIYDIIKNVADKLGIKVKFSSSRITEGFEGSNNPLNGEILISPHTLKNGRIGEVLVHEVVHALTTKIISRVNSGVETGLTSKQVAAVKGLKKLYDAVRNDNKLENKYPVKDIFEFIAHLTNDNFVKELESKDRNFLQKVVDFIADILGIGNANELAKKHLKDIISDGTFLEKEGVTVKSSDYAANKQGSKLSPKQQLLEKIRDNSKQLSEKYHSEKENDIKKIADKLFNRKAPTQYTEAATPKKESGGVSGSALKDVESTAKALDGVDKKKLTRMKMVGQLTKDLPNKGDRKRLKTPMGDVGDNYNVGDVEVTLSEDFDFGELNGEEQQADVSINFIGVTKKDSLGKGLASKELDRIIALADTRGMSLSLVIDPQGATFGVEGLDKVGLLNSEQLKEWYGRKGFLFDEYSSYGFRPAKNKKQLAEAYHKAKADGSNPELVKAVESLLSKEQTPTALRDVESEKKQIEDFGVAKEDVEATHGLLGRVFDGLKKAGLTAAKNVGEWVGIGKGEEKTYSLKINGKDTEVRSVSPEVVNGFYSPLEMVITESKQDKMPAKQWLDKFAKGEEAKWTGLQEWLSQQQGSVSKADIQKFLKENRVQIVEVVKGEDLPNYYLDKEPPSELGATRVDLLGDLSRAGNLDNPRFRDYLNNKYGRKGNKIYDWLVENSKVQGKYSKDTKFSEYQLSGDKENYKEVLVTMPKNDLQKDVDRLNKEISDKEENLSSVFEPINKRSNELYGKKYYQLDHNEKMEVEFSFYKDGNKKPFENLKKAQDELQNKKDEYFRLNKDKDILFKSSHFDEPNILVHLRMNTRTDSEGNKVLFIEEVQSDWGQKGKKEGFNIPAKKNEFRKEKQSDGSWVVKDANNTAWWHGSTEERADAVINEYNTRETRIPKEVGAIPNAPFVTDTNSWTKLGLKVALKEAVKQGADKIAWSTGTQQFDRWGSERIDWRKDEDDSGNPMWNITVNEQQGGNVFTGTDLESRSLKEKGININSKESLREILKRNLSRERNDTEIDKLTDRIWNRMQTEDSGTSLPRKEGMEAFYGVPSENKLGIVGNVAKSLFKQEPKTVSIEGKKNLKNEERIKYLQHFVDELPQLEKTVFENKLSFTEQELDNAIENGSITNESYKQGIRQLKKYEESVAKYNEYKERLDEYNKLKFGTTQHSIDITPEIKASVERGQPLFKTEESKKEFGGFETRDGKPIGFTYDTEKVARERFDISKLKKIGSGSDRDVYDLGNGKVLKVAKTARGLTQNIYEGDYYLTSVVPEVTERGLNYVVAENTPRMKTSDVVEIFDWDGNVTGKTTAGEMLKELQKFSQRDMNNHDSKLQDTLAKYGLQDIMNYEVLWNDFVAQRNWGYKDGKAYHSDGGTFGGVDMIDSYKGKTNLSDPEFKKIYEESRRLKKQFGDTDKATMYSKDKGEIQAQYRIESGKNIIEAIKNFDGSKKAIVALTHEIMHPTVVSIIDGAKEGNETGARHANTIVEEYNKANPDKKITLEQMIEGNDAFINGRTTPEYRAVQEFIAEAWEKYHHEGAKGFSKAFQEVLDAITEVFRQVYKSLTGTTLTPELRKMFDELLGKENVSEVVKAPEISSKAKNKFSNLREKIKQKQSLKIVSDEAENRHANSKLTEADNPVQEPNVKALESEGENAKNAAQAENVIIKIDSIISAATDVGLRKVSDISTDEKRFQGRDKLNAEKVQEIAENWKDADQDPIHVWTDPKDGKTYVLSGHHRLAAAKQAGREKVKVIDRSKDFTEEQAIRFAKEEANANRTMETAIERANTLRQKRERGDTKDDINKFLDREGKNKNFVNNLSRLNPKGKTIEALRATEKSDDKVTQKEVEKIADWIGEARDRNKNLTDAHENELFDFLMDREGSKRITTKQDFLSKVNSLAGAMDFNANEPLNIARYKHKTEGEKLYDKEVETQKGKISDLQQRINEINDRIKNPNNPQYLNPDSKDYEEIKKNADNKLSELNTELQAESKALLDLYQQKGKFARQGTEQSSLFSTEKNETELPEDYYNDLRDIIKDLKDEHKGITLDEIKEIAKNELGEYYSEPDIEAAYKMTEPQPPKSAPEPPKSAPSRPDKSVLTNIVNAENTPPEVKKKLTAHGLKYDPESHDEALQIARAVIDSLGIDAAVTEARARNFGGAVNTFIQTEALNALYKKEAQAKTAQEKYEAAEKFAEVSIALDEWARGDAGRGISALATFYQKSPLGMVLKENKSRKEEFNQWAKGKEESWDEFLERLNKTPEFSDYVSEKVQTELREERKKERSKFFKKVDDTLDKWINDLESGNVAFSSVVPPKLIAEALKGVKAAFKVGESATKIIGDAIDYISDKIGDNWDKDTFRAKIEKALNLRAEKTSVDRYADSLKKQIEELQKQIDAGSRNKNQSNKRQLTPEEQSLLDEKKRLQKELNDIDPKTTFAQRIQKQIDDIQRQIDAGKRDEKERKNKKEYSEEEKELQEKLKAKKAELEALSPLKNTESYKLAELDKFREKLKGLSEAEKDEVVSKAYKKLLDNGALDHADLREIIAKATGRGNLTEKQAARLQELNETINAAEIAKQKHLKERTEQTLKEYHKAIDMAAKAKRDLANEFDKKTDYLKVISSSIQGNTLGLLNVAVMNPLYNITTHLALRLPIGTVQSLFGLALGKAEMNTVFGKPMQAEFFGKGGRGFREAFKGLLTGMNKADYESKEIFSSQIRPNRSLRALLGKDNREAKMKLQEKLFHTFSVFPGATAETNFRLLNFGDKPMRYSASAATAAAFAKKYGIKFNTMDWKTFMEFPREIVKEMELAKGKSLKEAEQEAEYVVRSIEKEGERSTMQQDNFFSDMLEKVFSGGKHEGAKSLAKTLTISPFVKIPSNVLWLGYNLVHPQIALAQAAAHTIRSYGYRGKGEIAESKLQMREARYWMSVTMMGAALQAVMIPLIKAGIITAANDEDDSKKKRIADLTYQPQGMFNMTKFWAYLSGKNVNEVQGGFEIPLKYFGLPGALGNSLARDYKQLTPEQKENRRLLTDNLLELFDADDFKDIENGIFSSSSSLLQGLKGGDMTYYAGNMVNLFTNLIQPAAVSEFSRAAIPYRISGKFDSLGDKIKNDLSNRSALFRKLTGKYPKGKRNIWGEIIKKDDSYANRYFGFNNVTKDNFAQFIYEDAQKWDDEDFLPPTVSNSLGGKKLTAEQLDELEENIGLARKEFIRAYTNDIALIEELGKNYSDILGRDAKKAALQYLYQKGRKLGVDMFVSKHPEFENVVSEEEKQVEELLKNFKEINLISEDEINEKIKH